MTKPSLRTASIFCLVIWAAIWILFMLIRFSPFDIRQIPGVGKIMLVALALGVMAPIAATGLAAAALVRHPRAPRNLLTFGCAIAALLGVVLLFLISRWL
jgi:hypothetical protein